MSQEELLKLLRYDRTEKSTCCTQTFADLARFPRSGSLSPYNPDPNQEIRRWAVKGFRKYLIFYRVSTDSIEIIRIFHASHNIERLLNPE